MKRLCIGIIELTTGWKVILDQIGVWYEVVDLNSELINSYSVIILNQSISEDDETKLHEFNDAGGSILETQNGETFSYARYTVTKKVSSLDNTQYLPFLSHISTLDVFSKAELYNGFDNFDGIIDFEKHGEGIVCNLGINPDELMEDNSYSRKRFFYKKDKHPDELVSDVSKNELLQIVISLLKELHFQQGIPFINKWTSPTEQPIFAFRIDSDFGDKDSISKLYDIGKNNDIPMTWFLHVQAHEEWIEVFKAFEGQEIALHGYEHGTSNSYENILNNIEKGLQVLVDADIHPKGFCVPYALWNDALAEVLPKFEFEYSSEFSIGYDALPFYPIYKGDEQGTLQIPIHPICTGSLNRKNASIEEMKDYFETVLNQKLARFENVVFYHHPLQPGTELWNDLFSKVNELKLCKLSFQEYAKFWKQRAKASFQAHVDPETKAVKLAGDATELLIQVSGSHNDFELLTADNEQEIQSSGKFSYHERKLLTKEELKTLRASKLQLIKTSLLDQKNRIKL